MMQMQRREFIGGAFAALGLTAFGDWDLRRPNLVFGVLSDIHIRQRGWANKPSDTTYFHKALLWFRQQGVDGVVVPGDIADRGRADELEAFAEAWFDVFPKGCGVEPLFVSGNHDWWGQKSVAKMEGLWTRVWGEPYKSIWMKRVKGYAFIGQHWEEFGACFKAPFAKIGPFLEAHASELGKEKPFFYIQHPHPKDTCYGAWAWGHDRGDVTKALSAFPNAVAFSGHSHFSLTDERSIWQGSFTSIGASSMRYTGMVDCNRKGRGFEDGSSGDDKLMPHYPCGDGKQGLLVKVYDDAIVYERRDFHYGRRLGADWVQPLGTLATFDFKRRRATEAPSEFATGAALSARRVTAKPRKGEAVPALEIDIPAANAGKTRPFGYEVRVRDANGVKRVQQVLASGYNQALCDERAQGKTTARVSVVGLAAGKLSVEVVPFTSWECDVPCNYGRPLVAEI